MMKEKIIKYIGEHWTEILNVLVAVITLFVACETFRITNMTYHTNQNMYKHDSQNYSAYLSITKEGDNICIRNNDPDLFNVSSINLEKIDGYNLEKDKGFAYVNVITASHRLYVTDDSSGEIADLNDVKIDMQKQGRMNSNYEPSDNDNMLFDNIYKEKILELQKLYNVNSGQTSYYLDISYFNKYTYETNRLQLTLYPDGDGEIERYPYTGNRGITINMASQYNNINESWDSIINEINTTLENSKYSQYNN